MQLAYKSSVIGLTFFGEGSHIIIALHGYGESGVNFGVLRKSLPENFMLVAIDLPFHGATSWKEGLSMQTADLHEIIRLSIIELKGCTMPFSLLAYSMGGRLALHLAQEHPEDVQQMVLLAPDGMHKNFWYGLATQTMFGNRLFRYTMQRPSWFFGLIKITSMAKLLNKSVVKFVHQYLDDATVRTQLYQRWTCFRNFTVDIQKLGRSIETNRLVTKMVFGKHDRIISSKQAEQLQAKSNFVQVILIDEGHQLLKEKHAEFICSLFSE